MRLEPGVPYRVEDEGAIAEIELDPSYKFYTIRKFNGDALASEEFYRFNSEGRHVLAGISTPSTTIN